MKSAIRAIMGAVAGIFIMLAVFQALLIIPEISTLIQGIINSVYQCLIFGAIIAVIIGAIILYFAIK